MSLRLSILGVPVSLVATSVVGFFASPVAVMASNSVTQPKVGTVVSIQESNATCYVTLVDEKGIKYESVPAIFSVCEKQETFLNKKVDLAYNQVPVNDCPTSTDCGRTKLFTFITQIRLKPIN